MEWPLRWSMASFIGSQLSFNAGICRIMLQNPPVGESDGWVYPTFAKNSEAYVTNVEQLVLNSILVQTVSTEHSVAATNSVA